MKKRLFAATWRRIDVKRTYLFALVAEDDWEPDDDCEYLANLLLSPGLIYEPATDDLVVAPLDIDSLPSMVEEHLREFLLEIRCPKRGTMYLFHNM